ncbi:MAG TPA: CHAT domain-containing tetratricopeptide repeat protein [Aridibacter sp.]|nr:CHAT domain-containing tetratricopeptide repeat protein [Aridibacter sp.]
MEQKDLALQLVSGFDEPEIDRLLAGNAGIADRALADELKDICYATWNSEPAKARSASAAADALAKRNGDPEIKATADWIRGISELTKGELEAAVENIESSRSGFLSIGKDFEAAQATVAMLIPLALLGRYDDAIDAGRSALGIFERDGDELAAGKIELNLSNIASRRGDHFAAEEFGISARKRFLRAEEPEWRTLAENDLANTYVELNRFRKAEQQYLKALGSAREEGMSVTEAEIEACLGNLATFRGRYDDALRYLELSRRKFDELEMPHQSAIAELEIAEIYLTLNLLGDASSILSDTAETLRGLKLQGEEARARTNLGRLRMIEGEFNTASCELERASELFEKEENKAGSAEVLLIGSMIALETEGPEKSLALLKKAETLLGDPGSRLDLELEYLKGEALRRSGANGDAEDVLRRAKARAMDEGIPKIGLLALNSLGLLETDRGDLQAARFEFQEAVGLTESMRDPIAAEEFRMAYLSDKLTPYENLVRIHLAEDDIEQAFLVNERARSRTLAEAVRGRRTAGNGRGESTKLEERRQELREELNWYYSRFNRSEGDEGIELREKAHETERELAEVSRRIESTKTSGGDASLDELTLESLMPLLGKGAALVEYIETDGMFSAFTVTSDGIGFSADIAAVEDVTSALEGLRFQFGSMRYGADQISAFARQIRQRTDSHLRSLHAMLMEPLSSAMGGRDLVIVPAGILNYVPFPALFDGSEYETQKRVTSYSPGAAVWREVQGAERPEISDALFVGFSDEHIPNVLEEIEAVAELFENPERLTEDFATFANYRANAGRFDLLHLACHGKFRPDNPMFSSLHLADGFITVRDICAQDLKAGLVTLSACETGLSSLYPGNEILGLARGFLTAGALNLVLSLWTVSDSATVELMKGFYRGLLNGESPAAALNTAQKEMIVSGRHPYEWAPFVNIGRI